ncbi:MAG: HEAT repeat domain-containing protein [Acidobacteriia bacterium]|nr:HEAT repeat domain-containing protein [Terriglobia bacterium]
MAGWLGRDLTQEEREVAAWLQATVQERGQNRSAGLAVRQKAAQAPDRLCAAALAVLEEGCDEHSRRWLYTQLTEGPEFLQELMNPQHLERAQLVAVCRGLLNLDAQLDVRLARMLPGREENGSGMSREAVVRVLDVLDEISPGGRLILLLNHLTRHPDSSISAKATLLIGKRLRNQDWVARQLENPDGRVRANAIEGIWDVRTASARTNLWSSLKDKNNRVVGNALIGLHERGESGVAEFVKRMIEDSRPPFRWTAAWVMGRLGGEEFTEPLERAMGDPDAQVRKSAERALAALRAAGERPAAAPQVSKTTPAAVPARASNSPEWVFQFNGKYVTRVRPNDRP